MTATHHVVGDHTSASLVGHVLSDWVIAAFVLVGLLGRTLGSAGGRHGSRDIVHLAVLLHLSQDSKSTLWRDKARNYFLGHVFRGRSKQIFELDGAELLDDGALLADALVEALFELVKLAFFLVEVLDQPPSSFLHFMEAALKSLDDTDHGPINLPSVLRVPDVVSNELFDCFLPLLLQQLLVSHDLELVHESVHVLD